MLTENKVHVKIVFFTAKIVFSFFRYIREIMLGLKKYM